jgi:uncharacterized membrane protein YgaE (UPF0421/DUF939 family)
MIDGAASGAWDRVAANSWPILQGTAAATTAWVIAQHLVQHHQPFFAPIAAVVALNAARGERGSNALRLLRGVVVGIVVAALAVHVLGEGYATLPVAIFVAMLLALMLGGERMVLGQAAASATLVVATGESGTGPDRLVDALIGAGVALVVSQLIFPAEPVALLRRAEAAVLTDMAHALDLAARALDRDDDALADQAIEKLRNVRDRLTDLGRTRANSKYTARRSPLWWTRRAPIVHETENAGQLDLLGSSALMLTRTAIGISGDARQELAPPVRELAEVLATLARAPGSRRTRQDAADRALHIARTLGSVHGETAQRLLVAHWAVRRAAIDTMVFAGVDAGHAVAAIEQESEQLDVAAPPPTLGTTFRPRRRRRRRRRP